LSSAQTTIRTFETAKNRNLFKVNISRYLILTLALLLSAGIAKRSECGWRVGGDLSLFGTVGNLPTTGQVVEYEAFVSYENSFGAVYKLGVSSLDPELESHDRLSSIRMRTIWLLRSAGFSLWGLQYNLSTGMGITELIKRNNRGMVIFGALAFRSDFTVQAWTAAGIVFLPGITYRGCPLRDSGWLSDRFGLTLIIVG